MNSTTTATPYDPLPQVPLGPEAREGVGDCREANGDHCYRGIRRTIRKGNVQNIFGVPSGSCSHHPPMNPTPPSSTEMHKILQELFGIHMIGGSALAGVPAYQHLLEYPAYIRFLEAEHKAMQGALNDFVTEISGTNLNSISQIKGTLQFVEDRSNEILSSLNLHD